MLVTRGPAQIRVFGAPLGRPGVAAWSLATARGWRHPLGVCPCLPRRPCRRRGAPGGGRQAGGSAAIHPPARPRRWICPHVTRPETRQIKGPWPVLGLAVGGDRAADLLPAEPRIRGSMVTAPLPAAIRTRTRWLRRRPGAYRGVLAIPGARALIGASAASQIGNWLYNAALLGYVYHETHSAVWVGAATICKGLPYVLLGPFGGHRRPLSGAHRIAGR